MAKKSYIAKITDLLVDDSEAVYYRKLAINKIFILRVLNQGDLHIISPSPIMDFLRYLRIKLDCTVRTDDLLVLSD